MQHLNIVIKLKLQNIGLKNINYSKYEQRQSVIGLFFLNRFIFWDFLFSHIKLAVTLSV